MGFFDFLKARRKDPPIPESEKPFYRPEDYYTDTAHKGTPFEKKVVTFEERKKISYPSLNGLYVAEILLLEYCSYGKYPHPKNGYPGFWWFEYGIRNIGEKLDSLAQRGFIELNPNTGKYSLTPLGGEELAANGYVPYMHKTKLKTSEDMRFGPEFNVWSINRLVGCGILGKWPEYVAAEEEKIKRRMIEMSISPIGHFPPNGEMPRMLRFPIRGSAPSVPSGTWPTPVSGTSGPIPASPAQTLPSAT